MAESKSTEKPKAAPPPPLAAAGESADPRVHQLLAEREIAVSNGDKDAVKAADEALAELGVK